MAFDWEAEGLLKGTRGRAREARRELLDQLAADGVALEDLRRAVAEDRLAMLPVERVLEGEGRRYTAAEMAELAGIELEFLTRQRQAAGLPIGDADDRVFSEEDLEAVRRIQAFREAGLSDEALLEIGRVVGMAMAQVAAASRGLVGDLMARGGATERDIGLGFAAAARNLGPMFAPVLEYAYNAHLREQVRHDVIGRAAIAAGEIAGAQEVTACFADMVGFTRLGEELAPEELGAVTGRLAELAGQVAGGAVRLVKMIGDAAMFVSADGVALLDAALTLIDAVESEGEDFPIVRAGLASGPALARAGDWYGRPVNLASRITAVAYPGSVLCAAEVRDAAGDDGYRWSFAGERRLKGISYEVRLFRCRRE